MYLFYGKPRHNLTYLFVIIPKNLYHKTLDFIFPHTNVHNYNYYNILLSFIQFSFLFRLRKFTVGKTRLKHLNEFRFYIIISLFLIFKHEKQPQNETIFHILFF